MVFGGDGPYGPSPRVRPPAGATDASGCPIAQALPSGSATNFVPWLDFTRNNTARLPSLRASARLLRTSAGVDHRLAAHVENDVANLEAVFGCNAAIGDRGDDNAAAIATGTLLAGASVRPSFGMSLSGTSRWLGAALEACFSLGSVPSVSDTVFCSP